MKIFDFLQPKTTEEALSAWTDGAAWLGGGTNLVDLMKTGAMAPSTVIDISRLPGLDAVERLADGAIRIGALARNSDVADDPLILAHAPMVAEALLSGASGQLRNAATVGGNLMQKTRCPYFQTPESDCNRRTPGSGCAAQGGAEENLAILGFSAGCIATMPSDFAVPLAALGAIVEVLGPDGARDIPLVDFHLLPGDDPSVTTALSPGELILAVRLPADVSDFAANGRYLKVRERTSYAFAIASAAAALRMDGDRIGRARLALGAVAAKPWRVAEAEELLIGQVPDADLFDRAAAAALAGAAASNDNAWKIELARRTAARALNMAAAGTPVRMPALPASPFGPSAGVTQNA
ncbi:FAD binding domain-containing protein [Pelagovum pacificum]|uniref:Xanthine dehydrogenase family protein subunit M n=1 Tax=Pelagovum pacificum TaxID=2588711 RepID=A0A5C5GK52_9RHOB|nr:xanthine dehydrogenase family protein subunit M [Pelagovum pacificum]QQA42700.1 xanthine dehydrogenase family protein subunit M [Pelagovum pacificum]TNY34149.1 xanthine dehydrogenase family protein subunit M [Pelagovum pacificum]